MRLYSQADLTGKVNMIEKLVLGGTGTGDLQQNNVVDQLGFRLVSD